MERFIVGTGRCGSTLLSRMLAEHPQVLSIFEFFTGLDWDKRFSPAPVDGGELAALVAAEQPFVTAVLRRGYEVEEIVYPFESGRYAREDPLPWLLVTLLPRLTSEPDALFDELVAFAAKRPRRPLAVQYRELFAWLGARLGRTMWIERSGSSIEYLGSLRATFPEARFLHLHRDGPEVALSMREHHAYRLPIALLYDAPTDDGTPPSRLGAIDLHAEPRDDDPVSRILASRPPAEYFGRYWTDQIVRGFAALPRLDAGQYLAVRFEDLLARRHEVLSEIAGFFELEGGDWIERASALVRGTLRVRADELEAGERARLREACRPGLQLLGRAH